MMFIFHLVRPFDVSLGVPQGFVLEPMLFTYNALLYTSFRNNIFSMEYIAILHCYANDTYLSMKLGETE